MKNRILFLIFGLKQGGLETYLLRFLEWNKCKIHTSVFCRYSDKDELLYEKYISANTTVIIQSLNMFSPASVYRFYSFLKREKFDAICDFSGDFAGFPLFISKIAGIKTRIVFYRESKYQFKMTRIKKVFVYLTRKLLYFSATKYLSNSIAALDNFHPEWNKNSKKYNVIRNGVTLPPIIMDYRKELNNPFGIPLNSFVVGHVGRYVPAKNHITIAEVAKKLIRKYNNLYFLLLGRDVDQGLNDWLVQNGIRDKVLTPGSTNDVFKAHTLMDIFLFPSINEGQPNALIEAMVSGVPIVASNIPSHRECFPTTHEKYLIDTYDVDGYVSAIEHIMTKGVQYSVGDLSSWAKKAYDAEDRFSELYTELIR